jgi:hypothetical protein
VSALQAANFSEMRRLNPGKMASGLIMKYSPDIILKQMLTNWAGSTLRERKSWFRGGGGGLIPEKVVRFLISYSSNKMYVTFTFFAWNV